MIAKGEREALRSLFTQFAPKLNGQMIALLRDTSAADRALEELFARLPKLWRQEQSLSDASGAAKVEADLWLTLQARLITLAHRKRFEAQGHEGAIDPPPTSAFERLVPLTWSRALAAQPIRHLLRAWSRGCCYEELARLAQSDDPSALRQQLHDALRALDAALPPPINADEPLSEELKLTGAELFLGLSTPEDWQDQLVALPDHPDLRAALALWAERFAPLLAGFAQVPPKPNLLGRLEAQFDERQLPAVAPSRKRVTHLAAPAPSSPLFLALGVTTGALIVFLFIAASITLPPRIERMATAQPSLLPLATRLVAAGGTPQFQANYDPVEGHLVVTPLAFELSPDARSYQLWLASDNGLPRPLGVIEPEGLSVPIVLSPGMTLAVSLEPEGGSPLYAPTGAILSAAILSTP